MEANMLGNGPKRLENENKLVLGIILPSGKIKSKISRLAEMLEYALSGRLKARE